MHSLPDSFGPPIYDPLSDRLYSDLNAAAKALGIDRAQAREMLTTGRLTRSEGDRTRVRILNRTAPIAAFDAALGEPDGWALSVWEAGGEKLLEQEIRYRLREMADPVQQSLSTAMKREAVEVAKRGRATARRNSAESSEPKVKMIHRAQGVRT